MSEGVSVRAPHHDLGEDDYHEWVPGHRVKADSRMRSSPRMWNETATAWICNNTACFALAWVSDWYIGNTLDRLATEETEK